MVSNKNVENEGKIRIINNKIHLIDFDLESTGVYLCKITNIKRPYLPKIHLKIGKIYNKISKKPPSVTLNLKYDNNFYDYGCTVRINCKIGLNEEIYSIEWIREKGNMPKNSLVNGSTLIIENINQDDLGMYTCFVTNQIGQSNASILFYDDFGSIKHTFENFSSISNIEQKLDERLKYLYRRENLRLGDSFAIECLDLCNLIYLSFIY